VHYTYIYISGRRKNHIYSVAYLGIFFGGGVQQFQLRTKGRENRDLGAVAQFEKEWNPYYY
jgi:hypothetical protein